MARLGSIAQTYPDEIALDSCWQGASAWVGCRRTQERRNNLHLTSSKCCWQSLNLSRGWRWFWWFSSLLRRQWLGKEPFKKNLRSGSSSEETVTNERKAKCHNCCIRSTKNTSVFSVNYWCVFPLFGAESFTGNYVCPRNFFIIHSITVKVTCSELLLETALISVVCESEYNHSEGAGRVLLKTRHNRNGFSSFKVNNPEPGRHDVRVRSLWDECDWSVAPRGEVWVNWGHVHNVRALDMQLLTDMLTYKDTLFDLNSQTLRQVLRLSVTRVLVWMNSHLQYLWQSQITLNGSVCWAGIFYSEFM